MTREIKFRAWNIHSRRMHTVSEIQFEKNGIHPYTNGGAIIKADRFDVFCESNVLRLMQFTGLFDKNGVEIYEGDVIKGISVDQQTISQGEVSFRGCDYIVNFVEGSARGFYYLHHILLDSVEVIGNIYQNPELLQEATP